MDQFIKSFWNQIVGPIDNEEKVGAKGEEEEEKKAPSIYDSDKPKESSYIKSYVNKIIPLPDIPEHSISEIADKINLTFDDEFLGLTSILEIMEKTIDIAKKPYLTFFLENRKGIS